MIRATLLAVATVIGFSSAGFAADPENTLMIEIEGSTQGTIEIELLPDVAPNHVERIKKLASEGSYDGVVFHRVIEGFMAQTGDVKHGKREGFIPRYAGTGGSNYEDVQSEFSDTPFTRGVLGMARSTDPHSANSQFFIMFADGAFLNGQYTVFGKVVSGMNVVDKIKRGNPSANGAVIEPDYMTRVYLKSEE